MSEETVASLIQSTVEEVGPCRRRVSVTIEPEMVKNETETTYAELRQTVSLPGFRRGKAPRSLLERRFGDHVSQDVKKEVILKALQESMTDLDPVADPDVDFDKIDVSTEAMTTFEFEVDVKPEFELPNYKGLRVKKVLREVSDEDVKSTVDRLRHDHASWTPFEEGAAEEENLVIGHLILTQDDKEVFNREDAAVLAGKEEKLSGVPLPEDANKLLGVTLGQKMEWDAELGDDYYIKDLRGTSARAKFEVLELKRLDVPEADDELAGNFGEDTMADLEAKIRGDLTHHGKHETEHQVEEGVLDQIIEAANIHLPESLVERALNRQVQQRLYRSVMNGQISMDNIDAARAELEASERATVERHVRAWYVIEKIAAKEKVFATEDDVGARIQEIAVREEKTPTQVFEELEEKEMLEQVRTDVLESKVRKLLAEAADVVEVTKSEDDDAKADS